MYTVHIKFEQKGLEPITLHNISGDQNLVEVALENGIELHHNCGMVCGCSTCHIYMEQGEDFVPEISDKEEDFVDRARNPRINSRLACQCILDPDQDGEITITIPDQSLLQGE